MLRQLIIGSLVCLCLVLLGVLALPPDPLDLEHALAAGGESDVSVANLLLFRGDSPVATSLLCPMPNLNRESCWTAEGRGVLGSSLALADPSRSATLASH